MEASLRLCGVSGSMTTPRCCYLWSGASALLRSGTFRVNWSSMCMGTSPGCCWGALHCCHLVKHAGCSSARWFGHMQACRCVGRQSPTCCVWAGSHVCSYYVTGMQRVGQQAGATERWGLWTMPVLFDCATGFDRLQSPTCCVCAGSHVELLHHSRM